MIFNVQPLTKSHKAKFDGQPSSDRRFSAHALGMLYRLAARIVFNEAAHALCEG